MDRVEAFDRRLDAVETRLTRLAEQPLPGETSADPGTGERWDAGQVWAHLVEFVPYWIGQVKLVVDRYEGSPVPFGRTKLDPERIAAIERDRGQGGPASIGRVREHIALLRRALEELPENAWGSEGEHETLGTMDVPAIVEEFLVGHLEQHAGQLEGLTAG